MLTNTTTCPSSQISMFLIIDKTTLQMDIVTIGTTKYQEEVILLITECKELTIMFLTHLKYTTQEFNVKSTVKLVMLLKIINIVIGTIFR